MAYYKKGADAERELIHMLFDKGFSVVRVAGSGTSSLPSPDILALNKKKKLAFECKFRNAQYLNIDEQQMKELLLWKKNAGMDVFIAWKVPRKGWHFLLPTLFKKTKKAYSISQKKALKYGLDLSIVVGEQKQIKVKRKG